jgi:hypothetical protein
MAFVSVETVSLPTVDVADLERILATAKHRVPGELMRELCRFADAVGDDACAALLAFNPEIFRHAPTLSKACHEWVLNDNTEEAVRVLQGERRADHRGGDKFQAIDFSICKRMVMVGCGPCPSTVLHVCDKIDVAEIVALDVLPDAVDTARKVFKHVGISHARAEVCPGERFDYADADVVFVANMVSPKPAVLSRIADTAPASVQIVVREPYSLGLLWAESAEINLDPRLQIAGRGRGSYRRSRDLYLRRAR